MRAVKVVRVAVPCGIALVHRKGHRNQSSSSCGPVGHSRESRIVGSPVLRRCLVPQVVGEH